MSQPQHKSAIVDTADLGSRIRTRRREVGLTQTELATAAGTSLTFVSQLERGKSTAQIGRVLMLFAALGLELEIRQR